MAPETSGRPSAVRSLLLYPILIGGPLLGLAAIVHAGQRLHAPPAVGGGWAVDSVAASGGAGECAALVRGAGLAVSQSGIYATATFGGEPGVVSIPMRLSGDSLTGTISATAACSSLDGGWWEASVDRTSSPHRMTGRISLSDTLATVVRLTATRRPAETGGGEGH